MQTVRFGNRMMVGDRIVQPGEQVTVRMLPDVAERDDADMSPRGHTHIGFDLAAPGEDHTTISEVRIDRLHGMQVVVSEHVPKDQAYIMAGKVHVNAEGYSNLQRRMHDLDSAMALNRLATAVRDLAPTMNDAATALASAFAGLKRSRKD